MKASRLLISFISGLLLALLIFTTCQPAQGAQVITPEIRFAQVLKVTGMALESPSCSKLLKEEYPKMQRLPHEVWDDIFIAHVPFPGEDLDTVAGLTLPVDSPRTILLSDFWLALMPPTEMVKVAIHEVVHLFDYSYTDRFDEWDSNALEVHAHAIAEQCMKAFYKDNGVDAIRTPKIMQGSP